MPAASPGRTCGRRCTALLSVLAAVGGCVSADPSLYPRGTGQAPADLVVLDNHWHTALIFACADLPEPMRRDLQLFEGRRYVAIGWGDGDFYRADAVTSGMIPQAMFYSRGSVLLVIGFDGEPEDTFGDDVHRIPASRDGLLRAIAHVQRSFAHDNEGRVLDGGAGPDESRFYIANGRYGWNHTCNHWTAAALREAGLPVTPVYAATAGNLAFQIRQLPGVTTSGRPLPARPPPRHALPNGRGY
ncbi:MAG TPA: DUF2459 domain-containing protein [Tepidisphaeraceae bacterium]|jgi:uncharacterized protein (TIGR02117 family)